MNEHEFEPIHGLPAMLPEGETILWQGTPDWQMLAQHGLHVGVVGLYFGALATWSIVAGAVDGAQVADIIVSAARPVALGAICCGVLMLMAWLIARTTVYTITTGRLVMRFGVALPVTIQIPFRQIDTAALRPGRNGTGDVTMTLTSGQHIAYLMLWPHMRPWHIRHPEPTLRSIPNAEVVGNLLARALAASAAQPARVASVQVTSTTIPSPHVAAAA